MVEDDGNGEGAGNPYINTTLCSAYREALKAEINRVTFTVKLTGAIIALVVTVTQLGLYYLG